MSNKVPIIYSYLYYRLKKEQKSEYIPASEINEKISRILIRKGGFPRFLVKYIIQDMAYMKLIEKRTSKYYKLNKNDCDKWLRGIIAFC